MMTTLLGGDTDLPRRSIGDEGLRRRLVDPVFRLIHNRSRKRRGTL